MHKAIEILLSTLGAFAFYLVSGDGSEALGLLIIVILILLTRKK